MSMNNLTIDGEFRYIIQWFSEWSELQRDDFIPIMVDYITDTSEASIAIETIVTMNGLQNDMDSALKPMSLFQCRVKLFNQWNRKWPLEFKEKLQQKVTEIDNKVGEKIIELLNKKSNGDGNLTNGYAASNDGYDDEPLPHNRTNDCQQVNGYERKDNNKQQLDANETILVTNAVTLNDPMREVLNNETSVDDIELNDDKNKPHTDQERQVHHTRETVEDNGNVAHDIGINEDCSKQPSCITRSHEANDHDVDPTTVEPVEQVVQMRNLQINEEDHEDVTASGEQPYATVTTAPVTVTVNPVVVVAAQTLTTNAEVPLVV